MIKITYSCLDILLKSGFLTQSQNPQQHVNFSHLEFCVLDIILTIPPIHIDVNATTSIGPVIIYNYINKINL